MPLYKLWRWPHKVVWTKKVLFDHFWRWRKLLQVEGKRSFILVSVKSDGTSWINMIKFFRKYRAFTKLLCSIGIYKNSILFFSLYTNYFLLHSNFLYTYFPAKMFWFYMLSWHSITLIVFVIKSKPHVEKLFSVQNYWVYLAMQQLSTVLYVS